MKLSNTYFIIQIFSFFSICSFAQNEIRFKDTLKTFDPNYIFSCKDSVSLQLRISRKFNKFEIGSNNNAESKTMFFSPNSKSSIGLGVDYKWFGISLGISIPSSEADQKKFGKTDQFDLQMNVYTRRFIVDAYLQGYKGYYIENPHDFDTTWVRADTFPHRRDITTSSFGFGVNYILNSQQFSYKATFTQTEKQKKSAGSVIFGTFFNAFNLMADSNVVAFKGNAFNDTSKIVYANVACGGFSFGYAYNFVFWKHYYIMLSFLPGVAYQQNILRIKGNQSDIIKTGANFRTQSRFAMGYSGERSYWGVAAVTDEFLLKNSTTSQLKYSLGNVKFFYGRWLNSDKLKKKLKDNLI